MTPRYPGDIAATFIKNDFWEPIMLKPVLSGLAVAALFVAGAAEARTSYILPYNFAPTEAYITAEAATSAA